MQNKSIFRIASVIIAVMCIYIPANITVNGTIIDFTYRFIWSFGVDADNLFKVYEPNVSLLLAQIVAVSVITFFMSQANKS